MASLTQATDADEVVRFRQELDWCVKKLETGLQTQSVDPKQAADTVRILKILKSNKAPVVKKRQAMRCALGDYRKRMREEEKKSLHGMRHSKFTTSASKQKIRSKFLRQSSKQQSSGQSQMPSVMHNNTPSDKPHNSDDTTTHQSQICSTQVNCSNDTASCQAETSSDRQTDLSSDIRDLQITSTNSVVTPFGQDTHTPICVTELAEDESNVKFPLSGNGATGEHETGALKQLDLFHFTPSDNSFCFGFGLESGRGGASPPPHSPTLSLTQANGDPPQEKHEPSKNHFKLSKSDNEFVFNF